MVTFIGLSIIYVYELCAQVIKFTLKLCVLGRFTKIWIKFGDLTCQFCVCYSNIYNVCMCKHETIWDQLISYLNVTLVSGNLEATDQLTSYLMKVHNTAM